MSPDQGRGIPPDGDAKRPSIALAMNSATLEQDRVRRHTTEEVNARIDAEIRMTVERYTSASPAELTQRIEALDAEWDVERLLQTNASTLALSGVVVAAFGSTRGLLLAGTVLGFLWYHAVEGWCPPLPVLRRLGVRTRREIDRERFVLKYLRGDFEGISLERARAAPGELLAALAR